MYISSEQKYAYKLLHDAYYGSGLFSLGRGLKQHPRESLDNYNFRKMLTLTQFLMTRLDVSTILQQNLMYF